MITRRIDGGWEGISEQIYKNEVGAWKDVSRHSLFSGNNSKFEVRYFEIALGGYSSLEKHQHEHCVIALVGHGQVRLGEQWHEVNKGDVIYVQSWMPHQFRNMGTEPFGILCIVDKERDQPELIVTED